uniref:Single-stranded DNA-binding protein 2-like n=1 Tax=Sinocyclocheilus grahami TaxID=75366 RepID=A0A672LRU8_SINGR
MWAFTGLRVSDNELRRERLDLVLVSYGLLQRIFQQFLYSADFESHFCCWFITLKCPFIFRLFITYMFLSKRYSAAATQSPVIGSPPGDGMPLPPGFFQQFMSPRYPGGPRGSLRIPNQALGPGNQTLLPSGMDPTRQPGHPNMSGPMQRMTPRGMVPIGPQNYGGGMRPPLNALVGPGMPGINMGPAGGRPWPNPPNNISITYSSASPGSYSVGNVMVSKSNNSSDNMYSLISSVPPNGNRPNFPLGSGPDGPIGSMASMEPHHMNGSLGSGDIESLPKSSPVNLSMNNQPGTPRDDGEMSGNFLNPFQSESYSPNITMSV